MEEKQTKFLYRFLPEHVREFFLESGIEDIEFIAKTHGLSEDAVDELDYIQQELLFGYKTLDSLVNLLKERLGYDETQAKKIALDVIEKRFLPIDAYLRATAYRTFQQLGGNITVVSVQKIKHDGADVAAVHKRNVQHFAEKTEKDAKDRVSGGKEKVVERQAPKKSPPSPVASRPDHKRADEAVERAKKAVSPIQPQPVLTPTAKVVKEYDKKLDKVSPIRKGEKGSETGIVNAKLDPSHELAPPPPVLVKDAPVPLRPKKRLRRAKVRVEKPVVKKPELPPAPRHTPVSESPAVPREEKPKVIKVKSKEHVQPKQAPSGSILDVEHEAEIAGIVEGLKKTGMSAPRSLENPRIDEILRGLHLSFPSSDIEKRFRVLVGSRLSGVRDAQDFKSALARGVQKGGLGLDKHTASRIEEMVEGEVSGNNTKAKKSVDLAKRSYVEERAKKYDAPSSVGSAPSTKLEVDVPPKKMADTKARLSGSSVPASKTASGKVPVSDVQYARRLVGPVEELHRMTIDDFRRLPGSTKDAADNIKDDIEGIGAHDPGRRIRAIEAWRQSPLVKEYQRLLAMSLHSGVPIDIVLKDKAKNKKDVELEEFAQIRRLNTTLRY